MQPPSSPGAQGNSHVKPSPEVCVKCRGRLWCGPVCWILEKHQTKQQSLQQIQEKSFSGSSPPSVFVSHYGYPKVKMAPMAPTYFAEDADLLDNPERWFGTPLETLVGYRTQLVRSNIPVSIHAAKDPGKDLQQVQEIAMSVKKLDVAIELTKKPQAELHFTDAAPPMGPQAPLKSLALQENPSIPKKVDYLVSDTHAKAATAMNELYADDIPVHHLYKLLSVGTLGEKDNRKLVPTRWAITAVDDTIGKQEIDVIKDFPSIDQFQVFQSHYLDNHFFVLLIPREWSFDIMEAYRPGGFWSKEMKEVHMSCDYEFYEGRKNYAENVAGGYYATRLAVVEYLREQRKQAACVIFREIGPGYQQPMGVWQCRQNVRNAMQSEKKEFGSLQDALDFLSMQLTIPMGEWKKNSKLLDRMQHQSRILDFFK